MIINISGNKKLVAAASLFSRVGYVWRLVKFPGWLTQLFKQKN